MLVKLVVLLFFAATQADVFICPREKIFLATPEGNLTTDLALIPINTKCTISFDIPNGYALNIKFSVDFQSDGDTIQTIDNTNKIRSLPHDGKPITALPFWFAATGAQIKISTVTGDSKFFATYKYLPLDVYYQFQWETGEYFTLSQLSSNSFSTFTSAKKDQVAVTYAKKNKNDVDPELDRIFVYDGPDISKSRMIGTILDVGDTVSSMTSSGESISLVNLYGTKSTSYVLGNDASSLKPYLAYSVIMANRDSGIRGTIGDFTGLSAGYTFICTDCYQFHLTQFLFDSATISNQGYAMFQGQTPTHRKDQLFSYNPSTFTSGYMPQLIPTNIFTVSVHQSKINFTLSTSDNETDWKTPFVGRKGYIFSPSLWNDKPSSNNMNYGTKDLSQSYKYEVNIDKMVFASQNDSLTIQVAINYASPPVKNVYNQTQNPGKVSSDGTRLRIDLNGSPNDDVRISFEIKSAGAGTMGFLVSIILTVFFML